MKWIAITFFTPLVQAATVSPWALPAPVPSAQPSVVQHAGALHVSWIEPVDGGHRLRLAHGGRGTVATLAQGRDWFVNWADFPAVTVLADGSFAAHLLVKRSDAPYAYDVQLLRSPDGEAWSAPVIVHDDGTATEHGFVSIWPEGGAALGIAWLDGRDTGGGGHGSHGHGGGAMTVRAARFDAAGKHDEVRLDASTCDCCQTDAALTAHGPVLVYRDRDAGEVRDIAITRRRDGAWTAPRLVHADGWRMPACPVNGPSVAALGEHVVVAWYTAAQGEPEVRIAQSHDDGASFGAPLTVARGVQVQGRVDVQRDAAQIVLAWIDEDASGQVLRLARFAPDLSRELERVEVARLARGRGTGFPRLALLDGDAHVVWTDVVDRVPRVKGARVDFDAPEPKAAE